MFNSLPANLTGKGGGGGGGGGGREISTSDYTFSSVCFLKMGKVLSKMTCSTFAHHELKFHYVSYKTSTFALLSPNII